MPPSKHRRRRGAAAARGGRSAGTLTASRPRKKRTNKLYLAASVIIAVLVIAGFALGGLVGGGGGGSANTGSNERYVAGVGVQQPIASANHRPDGETIEYVSHPPTSGDHWEGWESCGFYEKELPDELIVHNLEHRNIVVSYNLADQAQIDQLRSVFDGIGLASLWGIGRSYDKIPEGQVALTAWGVVDTMEGVDPGRIRDFFEYAGNLGPELVPC